MARVGTPNLNLGTWIDEEEPGAGSQSQDNTGLNGNWHKIDLALGTQHNGDGTHKANVIKGSNLVQTGGDSCVDGSTLEFSSNKAQVKASGIGSTQLASGAVTAGKIATGGLSATAQIADTIVTGAKMVSGTVDTTQLKDDAVTAAKIAHENTRTKNIFAVTISSSVAGTYGDFGKMALSATRGFPMPRAGRLTRMEVATESGANGYSWSYASAPTFAQNDRITMKVDTWSAEQYVAVLDITAASELTGGYEAAQPVVTSASYIYVIMEVEFDD